MKISQLKSGDMFTWGTVLYQFNGFIGGDKIRLLCWFPGDDEPLEFEYVINELRQREPEFVRLPTSSLRHFLNTTLFSS